MIPGNKSAHITGAQMKRLQTVYGLYARATMDAATFPLPTAQQAKAARLAWASERTGRSVQSFSELSFSEAQLLIDWLQGVLGVKAPAKKKQRLSRSAAQQAGTAGRHDAAQTNETTMASSADLARIAHVLTLLGWEQAQLEAFLRSSRTPLRGRSNPAIRTLSDANKVYWALKRIAERKGVWVKASEYRKQQESANAA
jgi:hypothetical protein